MVTENILTTTLTSQYRAAVTMLRWAIEAAPDDLWDSADHENRTWRLAYHAVYITRYYLAPSEEGFPPWDGAIEGAESLGGFWEDPAATVPVEGVHSRDELLGFLNALVAELPDAVAALPLDADSGFEWYPFTRLELHLMNLRHIQHHTGQLIERLKSRGVHGAPWVPAHDAVGW
jgi:hypothetical protein